MHLYQAGLFADLDQIKASRRALPASLAHQGHGHAAPQSLPGAKVSIAEAPLREEVQHKLQHLPPALFDKCQQVCGGHFSLACLAVCEGYSVLCAPLCAFLACWRWGTLCEPCGACGADTMPNTCSLWCSNRGRYSMCVLLSVCTKREGRCWTRLSATTDQANSGALLCKFDVKEAGLERQLERPVS